MFPAVSCEIRAHPVSADPARPAFGGRTYARVMPIDLYSKPRPRCEVDHLHVDLRFRLDTAGARHRVASGSQSAPIVWTISFTRLIRHDNAMTLLGEDALG